MLDATSFFPKDYSQSPSSGIVRALAPSNIALVKYWGKYGMQLPKNASISFTLSSSNTQTDMEFEKKSGGGFEFRVYLDGMEAPSFEPKIRSFFERVEPYVPFVRNYSFIIRTSNTFPHSSGIASSASGMSALALCLVGMEQKFLEEPLTDAERNRKASFLARLGSGSAARSIEGPLVVWGAHEAIPGSSDDFGVKYPLPLHSIFNDYQDTILLVDKGEKQVSSTVGHGLMHGHPFAEQRFQQANENLAKLIPVLAEGNLGKFIAIVESEALSLHAMMMTSHPYFMLMRPNTLEIIQRIWNFREQTGSRVCFTLDAGANVHVLYPKAEKERVTEFIQAQLTPFCKQGEYLMDEVGLGGKVLS